MPSNLKDDPTLEAELIRAVAFGLRGITELKPKRPNHPDPRDYAARKVVEYLKLSNWVVTRGPPLKGHSSP